MYHILIDGDNVHCDIYLDEIFPKIQNMYGTEGKFKYYTSVVVQTNFIVRFESLRKMSLNVQCCQTKHKDATDARILMLAGMSLERGEDVIIVSNDKIYNELNDCCHIVGFNIEKPRYRLNKKSIMKALEKKDKREDIYIHDLQKDFFPNVNKSELIEYIRNIQELEVTGNDCVFMRS